jgi:ASC-1-like (ASCH) protein
MFDKIQVGHRINFQSSQKTIPAFVLARRDYVSFAEMLKAEDVRRLLPDNRKDPLSIYIKIPGYAEKSKRYGVICFDIVPI